MKFRDIKTFIFGTLRGRLILSVAIVHAVMMTLFITDLTVRQRAILLDRQVEEATALAQSLSTSAAVWIASDEVAGLQELVESQHLYPELIFAIITDERGQILAHTDHKKQGLYLLDLPDQVHALELIKNPILVDVIVPAQLGNKHVGWIRVGISNKASSEKLSRITLMGVLYAIMAIVIGSFIAWLMGRRITRRLYAVQNTINEVRTGNQTARSSITGTDEAASIASEFNTLLDKLGSQHSLLSALINSSRDIIILSLDKEYCYTAFNEKHREEMKKVWNADIHIGTNMLEYIQVQELKELANRSMDRALLGETFSEIQHQQELDIYYEFNWNPIFQNKEVIGITAFVRDITERKQAEMEINRMNRSLRMLSDINQALIHITDEKTLLNKICQIAVEVGGYCLAWVGYAEHDEQKTLCPVAYAGYKSEYIQSVRATWGDDERGCGPGGTAIKTGQPCVVRNIPFDETFVPWREAAIKHGYKSIIALPLTSEGQTFGAIGIYSFEADVFNAKEVEILKELADDLAFGITALRMRVDRDIAEEALRESEHRYHGLVDLAVDGILQSSHEGIIIEANERMSVITGMEREKFVGKHIDFLFSMQKEHNKNPLRFDLLQQGETVFSEQTFVRPDTLIIVIEVRTKMMPDGTYQSIFRDITERKQSEEKLEKAEMHLRLTLEATHIGIWDWDVINDRYYASPVYYTMLGYEPETGLADRNVWMKRVHPEDRKVISEQVGKVLSRTSKEYKYEARFLHADGTYRWQYVLGYGVEVEVDGKVTRMLGLRMDIDDRKRTEQQILKLNRIYAILSNINQAIVRTHEVGEILNEACRIVIEDGKFRMTWIGLVNTQTNKIDVVASNGISGDYFSEIDLDEELHSNGTAGIAVKTGKYKISNNIMHDDNMLPWRDNAVKYDYKSVASFPLKVFGKVIGVFLIYSNETDFFEEDDIKLLDEMAKDISFSLEFMESETKRKNAEEVLIQSEERFRRLAENARDVIYRMSIPSGKYEYISPAALSIFGYSQDEFYNNPLLFKNAIHPDWHKYFEEQWANILKGEMHPIYEYQIIHKSGEVRWINQRNILVLDDGGVPIAIEGIVTDITKRKQIETDLIKAKEKSEESDRLKSAFLANMSHEIRTPMNSILGFAELLQKPNLSGEKQHEYINIIEKSGIRMLNIINDIVDISKIEAGQMRVNIKDSNINEQIDYVYSFFKPEAEKKNIQLSFKNTLTSEKSIIKTDHEKIYAILTNLVKNSLKYTNEGSIEFGYNRRGKYLEFFVKDTGVGIPKERQEAIFERFIQSDISDKMARQGAGLGLSIAKAYVELLGGKIWVESEEGKGSIFYFTVPYNTDPEEGIVIENDVLTDEADNKVENLKILIVEDDEASGMLISIMVEMLCKKILEARTGIEAIEICRNNPDIDLILMDIQIPDLNGFEATSQIRQFNKDVIIIAQTAFALSDDREKAIDSGCNDYVSKPIFKDELLALIQKYFSSKFT